MKQITQGEDPWISLNTFLHDWWHYAVNYRQKLIEESPTLAETEIPTVRRWALGLALPPWLRGDGAGKGNRAGTSRCPYHDMPIELHPRPS